MRRSSLPSSSASAQEEGSLLLPDRNAPISPTGTLYVVSLPVGNPEDITLRALRVLREANLIVTEDVRLLQQILAETPLTPPIVSLRPRHGVPARSAALARLGTGGAVALVADCGTPTIVDPGLSLIRMALQHQHRVTAVPGASACLTALVISGLPTTPFTLLGSPPRRLPERSAFFANLLTLHHTSVIYESPRYLGSTLAELQGCLGDLNQIVVGCDLTHRNEQVFRGTIAAALAEFAGRRLAGVFTLVISGNRPASAP